MSHPLFRKKSITAILSDAEKGLSDATHSSSGLKKVLKVRDLTAMGIAAIVGAGIFSTIGNASYQGGPGVILLFVLTAVCCGFSALCYAEFASRIPVSGSAYTYAYAAFGELIAWIIGWDLLMEYAIGNIAVAISWSAYFTNLLEGIGIHIPSFLTTDYLSASRAFTDATTQMAAGTGFDALADNLKTGYNAWIHAPQLGSLRIIADLPALVIVFLITWLVYVGIRETRKATNMMVLLKVVCHLYDEEREDFRARVRLTLENPGMPANPIDPVGWVTGRKYIEQDYNNVLQRFLLEKDNSIAWLTDLKNAKWDNVYKHPLLGDISAEMFLSSWLAHDYLHIKQITKNKYDYFKEVLGNKVFYAGECK